MSHLFPYALLVDPFEFASAPLRRAMRNWWVAVSCQISLGATQRLGAVGEWVICYGWMRYCMVNYGKYMENMRNPMEIYGNHGV